MTRRLIPIFLLFTLSCSDYQNELQAPGAPVETGGTGALKTNPFSADKLDPNSKPFSEETMLINLGLNVIAKNVRKFSLQAQLLEDKTEEYCARLEENPEQDISLKDVQEQWKQTMLAYHQVEAAPVGPLQDSKNGMDRYLGDNIYAWPLFNACGIDEAVAATAESMKFDDKTLVTVRGLGALEYLFFESTLVPKCNGLLNKKAVTWGKKPLAEKKMDRCRYARLISEDVANKAQELDDAWDPQKGNFTKTLVDGSRYSSLKTAVNTLTDSMFSLEYLKDFKMAKPMGMNDECDKDFRKCPELAEHRWSGLAIRSIEANLSGLKKILLGSTSSSKLAHGFDEYLVKSGHPEVAQQILGSVELTLQNIPTLDSLGSLQNQIEAFDNAACIKLVKENQTSSTNSLCDFYLNVRKTNLLFRDDILVILALTAPAGWQGDND